MKRILISALAAASFMWAGAADIIAHRGFWDAPASAQNSRTSLQGALTLDGVAGTEMDLWLTADSVLVVHHDPKIAGVKIQNAPFEALRSMTLTNGETLPTFAEFLAIAAANRGNRVKLIVEIKTHSTPESTFAAADAAVKAITDAALDDITEYIAFDYGVCRRLAAKGLPVAYLSGNKTPEECHADGLTGIDYHQNDLNADIIARAHALGLNVNVWTVNEEAAIKRWTDAGVDRITTDAPVAAAAAQR